MKSGRALRPVALALAVVILLRHDPCAAANGINFIGSGNESVLMGGADVAVSRDSTALSANPAGMMQVKQSVLDVHQIVVYSRNVTHDDNFNSETEVNKKYYFAGDVGFVAGSQTSQFAWGVGLFGQGGTGSEYDQINTAFGTRDAMSSATAVAKVTPGLAYQVDDKMSLGVSVPVFYARTEQKLFPNTSTVAFAGYDLRGASAVAPGLRLGMQY